MGIVYVCDVKSCRVRSEESSERKLPVSWGCYLDGAVLRITCPKCTEEMMRRRRSS